MKKNKTRQQQTLIGAILFAVGTSASWAETKFTVTADVGATWVDNVDLVSDDLPKQSDYIFQVTPGFIWEQTGERINSTAAYTMQNYFYVDDDERSASYHQGSLDATLAVVKDYLFLEANGSYTQQLIDSSLATNNNLLFETLNVTDTLTAQVSPYFRHEFDYLLADISYVRGIVRYDVPPDQTAELEDVDLTTSFAKFGSADDKARLTWEARYEKQEALYEVSEPFRFESAIGELGLLLGKTFRLLGGGGVESDILASTSDGGFDESYWEAGFRWQPSGRSTVEALYGEHSYGETYNVRIDHTAKLLQLTASYAEGPTTHAAELVLRPAATVSAQEAGLRPDLESDPQANLQSDQPNNSINTDVYLRQDGEVKIALVGQRTRIELNAFDFKRTYISGERNGAIEETFGGGLSFSRDLSSRLKFDIGGSIANSTFAEPDPSLQPIAPTFAPYDYRDVQANIGFTEKFSDKISASLTGNMLTRSGDIEYTAHWVTLLFIGRF